ncbi:hypothetical protein JTB14_007486 [Gonioctena quinquepunctata]|nr:hypothetical protein JTB14_007486 [Gonioctena quinquepunctata]
MRSVDAVAQDTEPNSPLKKSFTWSTKVALHLLHQMLSNSKVIYGYSHSKQISMYKYTKLCCHGILAEYSEGYRKMKDNVKVLQGMVDFSREVGKKRASFAEFVRYAREMEYKS